MNEKLKPVRYVLYARKSTESEDRQVQSIEDQLGRLHETARLRGLTVVETLTEAKSAKTPDSRPVFQDMIRRIRAGEADGILCWELNRLSRNPVDSGTLSWLLQRGVLRSIMASEREYRPEDNVLLFNVESGMANQYILDLSRNVKRGMQGKLERGGVVGRVPPGYLNDVAEKRAVKDAERFSVIANLWRLMLTGAYTVPALHRKLNQELGYRTPRRRRSGGAPLSISALNRAFRNPFYAGLIRVRGREYPGHHDPMVTIDEFEAVQKLLDRHGSPRPKVRSFLFARIFRCAECGAYITAEVKQKLLRTTGKTVEYVYYHCTRHRAHIQCNQRSYVAEQDLIDGIAGELERFQIRPALFENALAKLRADQGQELAAATLVITGQQDTLATLRHQIARLTQLCYSGLVPDSEYQQERRGLENRIARIEAGLAHQVDQASQLIQIEQAMTQLLNAADRFRSGSLEVKRMLLGAIGSNCLLLNRKPHIIARLWVEQLHQLQHEFTRLTETFEPAVRGLYNAKTDPFGSAQISWSAISQDIQNCGGFPPDDEPVAEEKN